MHEPFPYQFIDLTHTLSQETPSWDGGCGFNHHIKLDYDACNLQVKFRVQQVAMHAGIGTHIDSPSHCIPGAATVDQLSLDHLIAPLIVIDVHEKMTADYKISCDDITCFENTYGRIQENSFVAFYTGWSKYWKNPKQYHNNHRFPSVSESVANLLISKHVRGIGIDTLSPDVAASGFPVHKILLGAGKYMVENIANLEKMPKMGAYILTLPMKGLGLTEAPVRIVGLMHHKIRKTSKIISSNDKKSTTNGF